MSVDELVASLKATQRQLVKALQDEYFCDDLEPPIEAFGWSEQSLREFMESGGETGGESKPTSGGTPDVSEQLASATIATPSPTLPAVTLSASSSGDEFTGRPIILCLGDATTEFASHIINQPTADVGSAKHKASLSVVIDPVATEFLRGTETDNPGVEHGPGWLALLQRDYACIHARALEPRTG